MLTESALKKFQSLHSTDLLGPWGIEIPTGILYVTTKAIINHIICPEFPLVINNSDLIPFSQNPNVPER